jgi:predicted short-subunit dehydrogenase-like oxidoreductase (DUF2520 family)
MNTAPGSISIRIGIIRIGIIGAGKVGSTLARLWHQRGYTIGAVYSRRECSARALAEMVGAELAPTAQAVIQRCDLTLLTVPDDAIETLAQEITSDWNEGLVGKGVIHTSGAHNATVLSPFVAFGAMVGSLHPAFPFADVKTALPELSGTAFALEAADEPLRGWLLELAGALGGRAWAISADQKGLYHAALALASGYTVTLYALAEGLLMSSGAGRDAADAALNPLIAATVDNLRLHGIPQALTGPLTRGDAGTVTAHLRALDAENAQIAGLYRQLARLTFPLLLDRGVDISPLVRVLNQEENNENNDS